MESLVRSDRRSLRPQGIIPIDICYTTIVTSQRIHNDLWHNMTVTSSEHRYLELNDRFVIGAISRMIFDNCYVFTQSSRTISGREISLRVQDIFAIIFGREIIVTSSGNHRNNLWKRNNRYVFRTIVCLISGTRKMSRSPIPQKDVWPLEDYCIGECITLCCTGGCITLVEQPHNRDTAFLVQRLGRMYKRREGDVCVGQKGSASLPQEGVFRLFHTATRKETQGCV